MSKPTRPSISTKWLAMIVINWILVLIGVLLIGQSVHWMINANSIGMRLIYVGFSLLWLVYTVSLLNLAWRVTRRFL